jgi:hypothetical protein
LFKGIGKPLKESIIVCRNCENPEIIQECWKEIRKVERKSEIPEGICNCLKELRKPGKNREKLERNQKS